MLLLSLCWLLIGLLVGALASAAGLRSVVWAHSGVMSRLIVGALTALAGGWLGMLLFGRLFGTATAVWMAVLGVVLLPRLITLLQRYFIRSSK